MSRHRAVRNLDLEEEFYDEADDGLYDEMEDISEEDQMKLLEGVKSVKAVLGRDCGIGDSEIKESLWYYYFDEKATISWLRKTHKLKAKDEQEAVSDSAIVESAHHRPGPRPRFKPTTTTANTTLSLAALSNRPTTGLSSLLRNPPSKAAGGSLGSLRSLAKISGTKPGAGLKTKTLGTANTSVIGSALSALQTPKPPKGLQQQQQRRLEDGQIKLSGLALGHRTAGSLGTLKGSGSLGPSFKSLAKRHVPELKPVAGSQLDSTSDVEQRQRALGRKSRDAAVLDIVGQGHLAAGTAPHTMYAEPSPLAQFIITQQENSRDMSDVMNQLRQEIKELLEQSAAVRREQEKGGIAMCEWKEGMNEKDRTNNYAQGVDLTFLRMVGDKKSSKKAFAFDTPSPDDKVLAAQKALGKGSGAAAAASHGSSSNGAKKDNGKY